MGNKVAFLLSIIVAGFLYFKMARMTTKEIYPSPTGKFAIVKTVKRHIFSPTEIFFSKEGDTESSPESYLRWEMFGRDGVYDVAFAQSNDSFLIILYGGIFDTRNITDLNSHIIETRHFGHYEDLLQQYPEHIILYGTDE